MTRDFGSIQVIVPHEDDELLMTAGVLRKAALLGLGASVTMVTNGDYDFDNPQDGVKRLSETLAGLKLLGIPGEAVDFLGYPDTGMPEAESFLSRLYQCSDETQIFPGHCSTETYSIPEAPELHLRRFGSHATYCRENVAQDLLACMEARLPENIFTTSLYDEHGDHSGLYCFVMDAVAALQKQHPGYSPRIFTGIVHSRAGDANWPPPGEPGDVFPIPPGFEESCPLRWEDRLVFTVEEPELKQRAIACHQTALKPDAVDFLYSFVRREELFFTPKLEE